MAPSASPRALRRIAVLTVAGIALLALTHAVFGQFVEELLQTIAQRLLILLQAVLTVLIAALAAIAVAALILPFAERAVAQLLFLADDVAKFVERLLHLRAALLTRPRVLEVLQHLRQLVEHLLGRVAIAVARGPLHAVEHVLAGPAAASCAHWDRAAAPVPA